MMAPLKVLTRAFMRFMAFIGVAVTVRTFRQGRRFSQKLRADWQSRLRDPARSEKLPWIIQINGTDDEFVGPWMYQDFRMHPRARIWMIPDTQHLSLLLMDDSPLGMERQLALKIALTGNLETDFYVPSPDLLSGATQPA